MKIRLDKLIEKILLLSSITAIFIVLLIFVFIFIEGLPVIKKFGLLHFLVGTHWNPGENTYGLLPMLIGSIYVTIFSLMIGVPMGLGCAIFLAEIAPKSLTRIIRPIIELLAGIPSVVYGFYGLVVLVPLIRELFGGRGFSV
ncbi:MAG: PstC family ABC transporter permease, partial [Desulfocucumaceae bacterium]